MTEIPESKPDVLRARPRPWLSRLWVRISIVMLLIFVISFMSWWWPRRTMAAVWRVNGTVLSDSARDRTTKLFDWWDPSGNWGIWKHFRVGFQILSSTSFDHEITIASLKDTQVNDAWLIHLQRFQNLQFLSLNDRQIGPGLDYLLNNKQLRGIGFVSISDRHLIELKRLPNIEDVNLWDAQSDDIGIDVLSSLPKLKSLFFGNCRNTGEHLKRLSELPQVETLVIQDCQGFSDDDLANLHRLPNLKYIDIVTSSPVSDAGLEHLSKLHNLETLCLRKSSGEISEAGLQSLQQLTKLKEFIVLSGDLSLDQVKTVQKLLPNTVIRGY